MFGNLEMDFGGTLEPKEGFILFEKIIKDKGSLYSVSVGRIFEESDIKKILENLKKDKKYRRATHNSYGAIFSKKGVIHNIKSDDGETGAEILILRIIKKKGYKNTLVCVTRWFGGVKLGANRFKHIQDATIYALDNCQ